MVKQSVRRTRRTHPQVLKTHVVLAAVRDDKTLAEPASSSICTPTRSPIGSASCWSTQPMPSAAAL